MMHYAFLFLACIAASIVSTWQYTHPDDVAAMLAFRTAIKEDPKGRTSDWSGYDPCGTSSHTIEESCDKRRIAASGRLGRTFNDGWTHVACNSRGRVTEIDFCGRRNDGIVGSLPPEIGLMTSLRKIHISRNEYTGAEQCA